MSTSKGSKALTVVISVILWLVIILAAFFAFTTLATRDANKVASIAGYTPLTVQSESMAPTFNAGDLIIIKKCDTSKLEVGDIVTFHTIIANQYALNTHRIETIEEQSGVRAFVTKGDNNAISDSHVISDGDIVGQYVVRLAGFGKVMNFLSGSVGFFLVIVLPMLLFFIYQVYHLIMVSISLKKAIALEAAEEAAAITQKAAAAAPAPAPAAEDNRSVEEKLAELERLKAEYEAKLAADKKEE